MQSLLRYAWVHALLRLFASEVPGFETRDTLLGVCRPWRNAAVVSRCDRGEVPAALCRSTLFILHERVEVRSNAAMTVVSRSVNLSMSCLDPSLAAAYARALSRTIRL